MRLNINKHAVGYVASRFDFYFFPRIAYIFLANLLKFQFQPIRNTILKIKNHNFFTINYFVFNSANVCS